MVALCHTSLRAREHFGIVEAAYVLATAGVFSAWQQQALSLKPRRFGWLVVVLAVPLSSLAADSLLHLWLDRANMRSLGISALAFTLLSAMFHWHIMQNGAMRVGAESRTFIEDMRQMPRLALTFVTDPARAILARLRPAPVAVEAEDFEAAA
jgi:membrane-anchored protein YejM (alkaline phosphatase superfamily)